MASLYMMIASLTEFPKDIPEDILELHLSCNRITRIPENLPKSLKYLHLHVNNITDIPDNLPENLRGLTLSCNQITKVPNKLPEYLLYLLLFNNRITEIENLTLPRLKRLMLDPDVKITNCFFGLIKNKKYKKNTLEAMTYRLESRNPILIRDQADLIKGHFELWSLREEGARFRRAQREYEDLFGN